MTQIFSKTSGDLTRLTAWIRSYSGQRELNEHDGAPSSRSWSDACAAWQKWHSDEIEPAIAATQRPWYIMLERARVETLASADLAGVRANLAVSERPLLDSLTPENLYVLARRTFSDSVFSPQRNTQPRAGVMQPFGFWGNFCRVTGLKHMPPRREWIEQQLCEAKTHLEHQTSFQLSISNLIKLLPDLSRPDHWEEESVFATADAANSTAPNSSEEHEDDDPEADAATNTGPASDESANTESGQPYRVFSRKLDQVGPARKWLEPGDRALLAQPDSPDRQRVQHIARQLQRKLLARAYPGWNFDCTEGLLDSRRLTRLITSESDGRVFRQEVDRDENQACVCFLVDLSGSMRRERRIMAALTLDMMLHTLDKCSISAEALAYTTRYFHPNPLVKAWRSQGSPPGPGRLNAARHIVIKDRKHRWKSARDSLALLLKDHFGRENLDGEALDWAARRLATQTERRKILVVLSDGEPYDEATEHANGAVYLEDHLRQVIKGVENSGISLSAIGLGAQVARFYSHSLSVAEVDELPRAVFDRIGELLLSTSDGKH